MVSISGNSYWLVVGVVPNVFWWRQFVVVSSSGNSYWVVVGIAPNGFWQGQFVMISSSGSSYWLVIGQLLMASIININNRDGDVISYLALISQSSVKCKCVVVMVVLISQYQRQFLVVISSLDCSQVLRQYQSNVDNTRGNVTSYFALIVGKTVSNVNVQQSQFILGKDLFVCFCFTPQQQYLSYITAVLE